MSAPAAPAPIHRRAASGSDHSSLCGADETFRVTLSAAGTTCPDCLALMAYAYEEASNQNLTALTAQLEQEHRLRHAREDAARAAGLLGPCWCGRFYDAAEDIDGTCGANDCLRQEHASVGR